MKKILLLIPILFLTACGPKVQINPISTGGDNTPDTNNNEIIDLTSSQVSTGVSLDDLGNIINGQYYFDSGDGIYYSSFDESEAAHIYQYKDGTTSIIFNGFGWSFVVKDGYLYFSGNEGTSIDGSYHLFKMNLEDYSYEIINYGYCFNMNFYKEWLYYVKEDSENYFSVYRSDLNGDNEQQVASTGSYVGIIFDDMFYYLSDQTIYRSNPDGSNPILVLEDVNRFIIGQGKFIYEDTSNNLKTANIDGANQTIVKYSDGTTISRINSAGEVIYFVKTTSDTATNGYAYPYALYRINFDGTNEQKVYESESYGYYINIVNDQIYALDYAPGASGYYVAITKNMTLTGSNLLTLPR